MITQSLHARTHARRAKARRRSWDLSQTVLRLGDRAELRLRDMFDGFFIFGGTGSGKSSSSSRVIAESMLQNGSGALFLCVKDTDASTYLEMSKRQGRAKDVTVIRSGGDLVLNALDEAAKNVGRGTSGRTEAIVSMLFVVMEIMDGDGGKQEVGEKVWERAAKIMAMNLVDLCWCAGRTPTIRLLAELLPGAPKSLKEAEKLELLEIDLKSGQVQWDQLSRFKQLWVEAGRNFGKGNKPVDQNTLESMVRYWRSEHSDLGERTRTSIEFSWRAMIGALTRGDVADLCGSEESTFSLASTRAGKILIIDLPVLEYEGVGKAVQAMILHLWQKEMERSSISRNPTYAPCLLFIDECQYFLGKRSVDFITTARTAGIASVFISQSPAAIENRLGQSYAAEFFGVLQTTIAHSCQGASAEFMSNLIGKHWTHRMSFGANGGGISFSESQENQVEASEFSKLARGGPENDFVCESYVLKPGAEFGRERRNYMKVGWSQK